MKIKVKQLSLKNISKATKLILTLWSESNFKEEYNNCKRILKSDKECIRLAKIQGKYVGFIYLNLRSDHVEGTDSTPVVYIEGIYVKPKYRKKGIAKKLVDFGEKWGKKRGAKEYGSDTEIINRNSIKFHKKIGFKEVNRVVCFAKKIN